MNHPPSVRQRLAKACDRFLFESCDPRVASVLRIAFGILLLIYVVVWMIDGPLWFSESGLLRTDAAKRIGDGQHFSIFFLIPATPSMIYGCLSILLLQTVLLILGCWSRWQMAGIFFWLVSFQHRNLMIADGEDTVFRWLAFLMIFLPLDHRWSLLRKIRGTPSTAGHEHTWALRLIQLQMSIIYLSAAWCKLLGETWRDGTALWIVSRLDDYFGRFWVPEVFFESIFLQGLTFATLAIELLVPVTLWIPRLRVPSLIVATLFHLGIEYSMNLFLFQWIMLVGLLSFCSPCSGSSPDR